MNDLDDLFDLIPVSPSDPSGDVARGQRALRRRRIGAAAGSSVAVVAVVGGLLLAGQAHSERTAPPAYATGPGSAQDSATTSPTAAPPAHPSPAVKEPSRPLTIKKARRDMNMLMRQEAPTIGAWRDVIAEDLAGKGTLAPYEAGFTGTGTDYGTKLDWNHGGMIQFIVGPHWNAIESFTGDTPTMHGRTYQGLEARVGQGSDYLLVSVRHADGNVVTILASQGFGNNGTTTSDLNLTTDDLLAAAADPRIRMN